VFEHGTFVQDVQYADFAGAKIGDAAIAEEYIFRDVLNCYLIDAINSLPFAHRLQIAEA